MSAINFEEYGMENYEKYAEYTKAQRWDKICELNGVRLDSFGTKKELKVLPNYLEYDEVVLALTSGLMDQTQTSNKFDIGSNTWLIVLTNTRFLCLDHALLTSSVDTQSVRHEHVQAVSVSQGWVLGKITIDLGSRTIVIDNCDKTTVKPLGVLANKWLSVLKRKEQAEKGIGNQVYHASSPLDELKKLAELKESGVITEEEFRVLKERKMNEVASMNTPKTPFKKEPVSVKYCKKCGCPMPNNALSCQNCETRSVIEKNTVAEKDNYRVSQREINVQPGLYHSNDIPKSEKPSTSRIGMKIWMTICFTFAGLSALASVEKKECIPGALFFGILGIMFLSLAKTPKGSKYIFDEESGVKKSIFVLICVIVAFGIVIASAPPTDTTTNSTQNEEIAMTEPNEIFKVKEKVQLNVPLPDGLKYRIEGSSVVITKFESNASTLNIPATIENLPVTKIGNEAFSDCVFLTAVKMPESVVEIGTYAFCGCTRLVMVNIPKGVTEIKNSTFLGCHRLRDVIIPNGVRVIEEDAFAGCRELTFLKIPTSVTTIETYAFSGCRSLKSITIPTSVTEIGVKAFRECSVLTIHGRRYSEAERYAEDHNIPFVKL